MNTQRIFCSLLALAVLSPAFALSTPEQKQRALGMLSEAVRKDPKNPELWIHLGFAFRKEGQMEKAQEAFEQARKIDPASREALYMLGLIYEKKGMKSEAISAWTQYLQIETDPAKKAEGQKHVDVLKQ